MTQRTVFFVSDQTGVTAETLGHSLLTQFDGVEFKPETVPFVDTVDKAIQVARRIDLAAAKSGVRPIVFTSFVQEEVRAPLLGCQGLVLDFFDAFLGPLEAELQTQSSHALGKAHGMRDTARYNLRIDATAFAMEADDGHTTRDYGNADVILTGVSRSGKTPTCLYLALQYGVFAANYPLAEEDLETVRLPTTLAPFRDKLYGLTIGPVRLRQIRLERRSVGRYASAQQVSFELRAAEALFKRHNIPYIDTTHCSIEEIASTILSETGIERRVTP
jgi:regulator of PEP synthase PpsR (kinase-PPPase family)